MTCFSLCLAFHAVVWVTPNRRPSARLEIPCWLWVMWYMARNHLRSGSLVEAKIVPAMAEVCRRQAVHWNSARLRTTLCGRPPQAGQMNPSGQRAAMTMARHCCSVPERRMNSASLRPFWNCTALRAINALRYELHVHGLYHAEIG